MRMRMVMWRERRGGAEPVDEAGQLAEAQDVEQRYAADPRI